jgi:putative phosphoesterase
MLIEEKEKTVKKVGVLSDTHDNMSQIKKAVDFFNRRKVDFVFHAGDTISPLTANVFKNLNCDMILIFGNNDGDKLYLTKRFEYIGVFYNDPYIGDINGKKIVVTHQPDIVDVMALKYDIVIYGHTHEKDLRMNKSLILNPGECCGYMTNNSSVAVVYPDEMTAEIFDI